MTICAKFDKCPNHDYRDPKFCYDTDIYHCMGYTTNVDDRICANCVNRRIFFRSKDDSDSIFNTFACSCCGDVFKNISIDITGDAYASIGDIEVDRDFGCNKFKGVEE